MSKSDNKETNGYLSFVLRVLLMFATWSFIAGWATNDHNYYPTLGVVVLVGLGILWMAVFIEHF